MLAVVTLAARVLVTGLSGSTDVYFLQPVVGEAALGLVFLASLPAGRSLSHRLAHDFVPLDGLATHARLRRVFYGITVLWAAVFFLLSFLGWYLLGHSSVAAYVGLPHGHLGRGEGPGDRRLGAVVPLRPAPPRHPGGLRRGRS